MKQQLEEVNAMFLLVQDYIDPTVEHLEKITREEQLEYERNAEKYLRAYNVAIAKYKEVAPSLSPSEIIEGFQQGCRLLQRSLGGWMCFHFDEAYIPIMTDSIRKNELHTAHLFLQALADRLGTEISSIAIDSLDSNSVLIRSTALAVVRQLGLVDAYAKVESLTNDSSNEIAYLAKQILEEWRARM
jgi:hypothetical protein